MKNSIQKNKKRFQILEVRDHSKKIPRCKATMWSNYITCGEILERCQISLPQTNAHSKITDTLFTVARKFQPVQMSDNIWINKENVVSVHTGIYAAVQKNKTMTFSTEWVELESITPKEMNQNLGNYFMYSIKRRT